MRAQREERRHARRNGHRDQACLQTGKCSAPTMSNTRLPEMIETKCPRFLPQTNNDLHCAMQWHTRSQGRHKDTVWKQRAVRPPPSCLSSLYRPRTTFPFSWDIDEGAHNTVAHSGDPTCQKKNVFVFLSLQTAHDSTDKAATVLEDQ